MAQNTTYDLFLSYSSEDRPWVSEFASVLREEGLKAWLDVHDLAPGERWKEKIQEALRSSNTLVVILNAHGIESPWTFFELGAAIADGKRIVPILREDVDVARIPAPFRQYHILKATSPAEAAKQLAHVLSRQTASEQA